jgi:hypothetical protein
VTFRCGAGGRAQISPFEFPPRYIEKGPAPSGAGPKFGRLLHRFAGTHVRGDSEGDADGSENRAEKRDQIGRAFIGSLLGGDGPDLLFADRTAVGCRLLGVGLILIGLGLGQDDVGGGGLEVASGLDGLGYLDLVVRVAAGALLHEGEPQRLARLAVGQRHAHAEFLHERVRQALIGCRPGDLPHSLGEVSRRTA